MEHVALYQKESGGENEDINSVLNREINENP